MKYVFPLIILGLSGCTLPASGVAPKPAPADETPAAAPSPPAAARTVEQFDTTTEEQRAAASQPASGGKTRGTTVASLGDPSQPGFWIQTSLVSKPGAGRITSEETGESVEVELIPLSDGSSRVSLAAWRLLDVPLTELATLEVFVN